MQEEFHVIDFEIFHNRWTGRVMICRAQASSPGDQGVQARIAGGSVAIAITCSCALFAVVHVLWRISLLMCRATSNFCSHVQFRCAREDWQVLTMHEHSSKLCKYAVAYTHCALPPEGDRLFSIIQALLLRLLVLRRKTIGTGFWMHMSPVKPFVPT
jgi:hypothetical protein